MAAGPISSTAAVATTRSTATRADDKVEGANGSDTVDGGPGVDQIYGDIGSCSFSCSSDADTLYAADGEKDAVDCGGGADTAHVDQLDVVAFCASVDRQSVGGPPGSKPAPGPSSPAFTVTISGGAGVAKGVGATVACPAACSFSVSVVLSAKTARKYGLGKKVVTIGTARGTLLSAGRKTVKVHLSAKARRKLRRVKKLAATLKVSVKDASGKTTTQTKAVTLKR